MKIMITGKNGYIANALKNILPQADTVSVKNLDNFSFLHNVDVVIHTAALVHKKETPNSEQQYAKVNTELTIQLAQKAKELGVKQFIFFSTMAVYGKLTGEITEQSNLTPNTFYGKSKLAAEIALLQLIDDQFKVVIIRPPMVYGPNSPGNYALLSKFSKSTLVFPKVENKRSMIYIGNLISLIREIIDNEDCGIFHPQDPQFINTTNMVTEIAKVHNKKVYHTKLGALLLKMFFDRTTIYNKLFGDLYYSPSLSSYNNNSYQKYRLEEAILISEKETL
ncbi:NAD-dependent epimerase/dehydratase family protein [Solibacillus sp. CAU 1738]|uniref:NAD-dependent epimerase/dehydratase family protein n=1 Tax=Solibacillus sp. CAU 1738 TaxID=3140363 RepID=UPI003260A23C